MRAIETENWARERFNEGLLTKADFNNPGKLAMIQDREEVALHEEGHAGIARVLGWSVNYEEANERTGLTKTSPNRPWSPETVLDGIVISIGGEEAENMLGISDHSGCGFDRGKQRFLATLYQRMTGSIRSIGEIIGEQRSRARSFLGGIGIWAHRQNAMKLQKAGVLV